MSDLTRIFTAIEQGDPHATAQLLPLVYNELRKLAAQKLAQEQPGQTLQATALVHEAYLRLVGSGQCSAHWDGRGHFFAAAAESMRRILVNRARDKRRIKRGDGAKRVELDLNQLASVDSADELELLALDEALEELSAEDRPCAELVKLRFFAGLALDEAAQTLGISRRTADRHWAYARAWLFERLQGRPLGELG
jgi:RNA polymerase sigma factor (TIGR02999 family)